MAKMVGSEGEKLEGRVELKEVVVVERKAERKMRVLVSCFGWWEEGVLVGWWLGFCGGLGGGGG